MVVAPDYRLFRIEVVAQLVDGAWNAGVRIRRVLSTTNRCQAGHMPQAITD